MRAELKDALRRYLIASVWVYFTLLTLWIVGHLTTGDRYVPIALATILGPYLFLPLPLILTLALLLRRKDLLAGVALGVLVFLAFWGKLFLPKSPPSADGPPLTVMTYNVLGMQGKTDPALATLRSVPADLVFLQELTPELALEIERELARRYPFRALQPEQGVSGLGVISRYPLTDTGESLELKWVGEPQILRLKRQEAEITLIHFHSWAFGLGTFEALEHNFRLREAQALVLANYARDEATSHPVIAAGDLNAVGRSDAYRRIDQVLDDAWLEGGVGWGHTFPGAGGRASSRPELLGVASPQWLARIDYIFISDHWQVSEAWLAPFDGVSDHRGVVARLVLPD